MEKLKSFGIGREASIFQLFNSLMLFVLLKSGAKLVIFNQLTKEKAKKHALFLSF